jgi:hypothetical protein
MGGCQCQKFKESTLVVELNGQAEFKSGNTMRPNNKVSPNSNSNPKLLIGPKYDRQVNSIDDTKSITSVVDKGKGQLKKFQKNVIKYEGIPYNEGTYEDMIFRGTNNIQSHHTSFDRKEFINNLFFEYNFVRSNPMLYADKIKLHMQHINEKNNKFYFETEDQKVVLSKGKECFMKAIECLMQTKPLPLLQLVEDIALELNDNMDSQKINQFLKNRTNDYCKYNIDITGKNAETSCILQLVDDTNNKGARRDNILNPLFKYIGISMIKGKGRYYNVYSTFSN